MSGRIDGSCCHASLGIPAEVAHQGCHGNLLLQVLGHMSDFQSFKELNRLVLHFVHDNTPGNIQLRLSRNKLCLVNMKARWYTRLGQTLARMVNKNVIIRTLLYTNISWLQSELEYQIFYETSLVIYWLSPVCTWMVPMCRCTYHPAQ
jgi:hypothetical protein